LDNLDVACCQVEGGNGDLEDVALSRDGVVIVVCFRGDGLFGDVAFDKESFSRGGVLNKFVVEVAGGKDERKVSLSQRHHRPELGMGGGGGAGEEKGDGAVALDLFKQFVRVNHGRLKQECLSGWRVRDEVSGVDLLWKWWRLNEFAPNSLKMFCEGGIAVGVSFLDAQDDDLPVHVVGGIWESERLDVIETVGECLGDRGGEPVLGDQVDENPERLQIAKGLLEKDQLEALSGGVVLFRGVPIVWRVQPEETEGMVGGPEVADIGVEHGVQDGPGGRGAVPVELYAIGADWCVQALDGKAQCGSFATAGVEHAERTGAGSGEKSADLLCDNLWGGVVPHFFLSGKSHEALVNGVKEKWALTWRS
jgi:hypothetical protein